MQVNSHILFYCRTKSVTQILEVLFTGVARGAYGAMAPQIFRTYRHFVLWEAVAKKLPLFTKYETFWSPLIWPLWIFRAGYATSFIKIERHIFAPPQFLGWLRYWFY